MKILHIIDYFQPQLGYQETYLAREQIKAGHNVAVVTSDRYRKIFFQGGGAKPILGARKREDGFSLENEIPVYRLPVKFELVSRIWLSGLEKKIAELAPDAIHIHGLISLSSFRTALAVSRNPALRKVVLLVDDHMYPEVSNTPLKIIYPFLRPVLIPQIRRAADWIVGVSSATRDFMVSHYGLAEDEIRIIRLGVDDQLFGPDLLARKEIRQEFGILETDFVCITTGKIAHRKQVDVLIQAIATLKISHPEIRLLLVGYASEPYRTALEEQIKTLGLENRVNWQPTVPQEKLPCFFAAADVAIWPAEHSISFLEAMSCGLPLIVSDAPKPSEDVRHANGLTFKTGDHNDLALQIKKLIETPALKTELGAAGRVAVEKYYAWRMINEQFMALYSQPNKKRTQ